MTISRRLNKFTLVINSNEKILGRNTFFWRWSKTWIFKIQFFPFQQKEGGWRRNDFILFVELASIPKFVVFLILFVRIFIIEFFLAWCITRFSALFRMFYCLMNLSKLCCWLKITFVTRVDLYMFCICMNYQSFLRIFLIILVIISSVTCLNWHIL